MVGVKIDYERETIEFKYHADGSEEGYEFFQTEPQAKAHARNAEYVFLRAEWNHLTDYNSERAKFLEKRLWGDDINYKEGEHRAAMQKKREP